MTQLVAQRYFDGNATMPPFREAKQAWIDATENSWHNPSALYRASIQASVLLDDARARIAGFLGCEPESVIFNSGATEGNNSVARYVRQRFPSGTFLLGKGEHSSVYEPIQAHFPGRYEWLDCDDYGRISLSALESRLKRGGCICVSVMAASNESGIVQPWRELAELCRRYQVWYHCDAAQHLGKFPAEYLGMCDFVTASAHKLGGPKGVGFVKISKARDFLSLLGGGQEMGHRSGTENYPGIVAMLEALEQVHARSDDDVQIRASWRDHFEAALLSAIPGVGIVGCGQNRLWNTSLCLMPGRSGVEWVRKLDRAGFSVGVGAACSSAKEAAPSTLLQLGYSEAAAKKAIRISSTWTTQESDWQALLRAIKDLWADWASRAPHSDLLDIESL